MLGLRLKTARITRKMTLAELSKRLSVKEVYLQALEEERFSILPPAVYTLGYIKILAEYFTLSYHDLKADYLQLSQQQEATPVAYDIAAESFSPKNYFLWHSIGGLLLFFCLLYSFYSILRSTGFLFLEPPSLSKEFHPLIEKPSAQPQFDTARLASFSPDVNKNRLIARSKDLDAVSHIIEIKTLKESWLMIKNPQTKEELFGGIFQPSEELFQFKATLPLQFYVTNATSLIVYVDGQPFLFSKNIAPNNTARFTIK